MVALAEAASVEAADRVAGSGAVWAKACAADRDKSRVASARLTGQPRHHLRSRTGTNSTN